MKNKFAGWVAVAALLAGAGAVWAVPVQWTVGPATLQDGSTLSGSFVYDADTGNYYSVNISTTGAGQPAATFTVRRKVGGASGSGAYFFQAPVTGSYQGVSVLVLRSATYPDTGGSLSVRALLARCDTDCSSLDVTGSFDQVALSGQVVPSVAGPGAPAIQPPPPKSPPPLLQQVPPQVPQQVPPEPPRSPSGA